MPCRSHIAAAQGEAALGERCGATPVQAVASRIVRILCAIRARETDYTSRRGRSALRMGEEWRVGGTPLAFASPPPRRASPLHAPSPCALLSPSCCWLVQGRAGRRRGAGRPIAFPASRRHRSPVNFPRDFGDPGGVRSALAGRGVTYGINYIGDVLGNPVGGFEQGTRYIGRLEFAACRRHGEGDRLEGAHLLHQRLSDPWAEHLGAQPRRADAGELHRGVAVDAAVRAVAASRSCWTIT